MKAEILVVPKRFNTWAYFKNDTLSQGFATCGLHPMTIIATCLGIHKSGNSLIMAAPEGSSPSPPIVKRRKTEPWTAGKVK